MSDTPASFTFRAPGPYLSMNDRDHWSVKARKIKAWRAVAAAHARQIVGFCPTPAEVWLTINVADSRRRDPHNYYPTVKAVIDGMVDAGCWPDDSPEYVRTLEPILRVVGRAPKCVTVTVTERAA